MTKKYKIDGLNVGDIVYVPINKMRGFSYLGTLYYQRTVARITPKKTKMVDSDGREYDRRATFYKELDDEMLLENRKTSAKLSIIDAPIEFSDISSRLIKKISHLDDESLFRLSEICTNFKNELKNIERSNA